MLLSLTVLIPHFLCDSVKAAPDYARAGVQTGRAGLGGARGPILSPVTLTGSAGTTPPTTTIGVTESLSSASNVPSTTPAPDRSAEIYALTAERDALKNQLDGLRSENARCKKQQTGWTVATVVGGIGVVGTTAGAIYQGADWSNKNKELGKKQDELKATQSQIDAAKKAGSSEQGNGN
jgi:hypothetical protein